MIKSEKPTFSLERNIFIYAGETAKPIRSPLREKNIVQADTPYRRSPIKTSLKSSPVKTGSPSKTQSPIRTTYSSSPIRTDTFKVKKTVSESPAKLASYSRVFEDKDGSSKSEETYNRESSEKKTTIMDGKPEDGNYTKTTITEREETIEKREVLKFTEVAGKQRPRSPQKILEEYRAKRDKEMSDSKQKIKIDLASHKTTEEDSKTTMGSPSRFGSCRDTGSAVDEVFSSPVRRSRLDLFLSPSKSASKASSPVRKFALEETESKVDKQKDAAANDEQVDMEEDDGSYRSAQRKRLKALATKFTDYDEEDSESIKQVLAQATATGSPYKRDLTKTVDVDKIINRSNDPNLVKSLKAQGFEETSSKSKLVYDFTKKQPVSTTSNEKDSSPFRPDPMQYIRPQKSNPSASTTPTAKQSSPIKTAKYRSVSPTRMASPQQRPPSPFKPHPLQFVSPQKANLLPPPPPPKPPRTYIDMEEEALELDQQGMDQADVVYKSETRLLVNDEERTDTASRRSILEKKSLFEEASPKEEGPDPAMLPLSQRKALFEKNKSVPKPIARFGESVTPAMLSKASSRNVCPASEPAWKRQRRNQSPETSKPSSFLTPALKPTENSIPGNFRRTGIETKKNLFDSRWKSNDIAKSQEDAKKRDLEMLMNRFKTVSDVKPEEERPSSSPVRRKVSPAKPTSSPQRDYPGVDLKKIKVSPPRPGNLYPDLTDIHDRPETAMSEESSAPSEAPSLGTAIKRMASPLKCIAENNADVTDEEMEVSGIDEDINDMLDEALDDSQVIANSGPTPPKVAKSGRSSSPSTSSATSWEFQTPLSTAARRDFKTPRVDNITDSPQAELPQVETESGSSSTLMHTVSFYRKQKPASNVTQLGKIVRNNAVAITLDEVEPEESESDSEEKIRADIASKINKLQEEVDEQMQRRAQASKALGICEGQNEFEGSYERVEFERLLLEAHHKHNAASAEINRLKNLTARGQLNLFRDSSNSGKSKGTISLNGVKLPLKPEFVKMIQNPGHGGDDFVHYFVCLVKYRSQVIATQMLSTIDGINRSGQLEFPNLINIKELDFDFQIYLEVYGLQTPKEVLTHEAKYHIRKDKSLFSLGTPLKKLKKMESKFVMTPSSNPVNALSIRKSKFGMVGYTTITIDSLRTSKSFKLEKVPNRSPLEGSLLMNLTVHSESSMQEKGFLTYFTEVNGYGDWHRRWCVLRGTFFDKYSLF